MNKLLIIPSLFFILQFNLLSINAITDESGYRPALRPLERPIAPEEIREGDRPREELREEELDNQS